MNIVRLSVWFFFLSLASVALPGQNNPQLQLPDNLALPRWSGLSLSQLPPNTPSIRSGDIELVHAPDRLGAFEVRVGQKPFAVGQAHPAIAYLQDGALQWFDLSAAPDAKCTVNMRGAALAVAFECTDSDGALWKLNQEFRPGSSPSTIDIRSRVTVDRDRAVAFLPMFLVFPGVGTFGAVKGQALFAGLEYLENEPSSSEADVIGPASHRQVPDNLKITFPLMALQQDDRYLALIWQMRPQFAALFDSPDRLFNSGGHVMGLLFPGSDGKNRNDGSVLPKSAQLLQANQPLVLNATLAGGKGKSVVPAVEQFVRMRGLPPKPVQSPDLQNYASQAAGGWLHSKIREGDLVRHAIAQGGFKAQPAADAAVWMEWLAGRTQDSTLAEQLRGGARQVLAAVPSTELNSAAVGHVRYPLPSLLFGHVAENATRARETARKVRSRFQADGSVVYQPQSGGTDYAKTHFSHEASGLTSAAVLELLQAAAFCGDAALVADGTKELRAMRKFDNGVPRGAQTWECPLHTPDILASAQMVKSYTLGYELTGDKEFLEQARYWAWTGVPFIYLVNPTGHPIGLYSTIAVYGATQWRAPVWLGLPVQWCGLVYADSLYQLSHDDPSGPWKRLADGITISGIQQSWPGDDPDRQGLLPDSFALREQRRNGPAINPATVEACAAQFFGTPAYGFHGFLKNGIRVHAPGAIIDPVENGRAVRFRVEPWSAQEYFVLLNGLKQKPQLRIGGGIVDCAAPHELLAQDGWLILKLSGSQQIDLAL